MYLQVAMCVICRGSHGCRAVKHNADFTVTASIVMIEKH